MRLFWCNYEFRSNSFSDREGEYIIKYFVKYISIILLVILTAVDIGWIAEFGICIVRVIGDIIPATGELSFITTGAGWFMIVIYAVLILVLLIEIAVKVFLYVMSVKKASYGYYMLFSVANILESVINVIVLAAVGMPLVINSPGFKMDSMQVTEWTFVIIGIYLFTGFFAVLDLLSANQCRKDEEIFY